MYGREMPRIITKIIIMVNALAQTSRNNSSSDQATPKKRKVMSYKGVELFSEKLFMSHEGVF